MLFLIIIEGACGYARSRSMKDMIKLWKHGDILGNLKERNGGGGQE